MADIEVTVSKIVEEDLDLGTGAVDVPTSDGGTRQGNKINAASIPLKVAGAADSDLTSTNVDDALAEIMGAVDALAADTYSSGEVDDLLAAKSDAGHGHAISDVTGLQTALNGKAAASHTHAQSEITNLSTDLAAKAPLASPTFTGTPKAPTAGAATNDTQIATTAFVKTAIDNHHAASSSDHDDRYYTETEVDTKLGTKADLAGSIAQDFSANGLTVNAATLAAINRIVVSSGSIVDAIIYDTSRDSDGGAWRERCQHLSWFNETLNTATRGKTAKFPAIALIVATTTSVTIFDATDPALPMWVVFSELTVAGSSTTSSIAMINGVLYLGRNIGMQVYDFIADSAFDRAATYRRSNTKTPLVNRNIVSASSTVISSSGLVNNTVNDVTATILPGAPIDPATGLPVPTVAVATAGGVSVIKHDGTVVNSATTSQMHGVSITPSGDLFYVANSDSGLYYARGIGALSSGFALAFYDATTKPAMMAGSTITRISAAQREIVKGNGIGLVRLQDNPTTPANGMVSYVTKDYFSGILPGDIRRAWLASGTAETIAGAELVVNGDFSSHLSNGWTDASSGTSWLSWNSGGQFLELVGTGNGVPIAQQSIPTVAGKRYRLIVESATGGIDYAVGSNLGGNNLSTGALSAGKGVYEFTATGSTAHLSFNHGATATRAIDNVSIRLVDEDRSVKAKGLGVYGSLTKSAVAPGAELMGYSGFSALNYLEEPYSSDLDFGTGDFAILGWFYGLTATGLNNILLRIGYSGGYAGAGFHLMVNSEKLLFKITNAAFAPPDDEITSTQSVNDGTPHFFVAIRRGSKLELYIDGVKAAPDVSIVNATGSLNNASATTRIGFQQDGNWPFSGGLSLLRTAAYAPTPDQIRAIYEAERHLFTENAKCLLGGASNAVQALDYDPDTEQLLVGTGNGVSVFQGLRRVNYISDSPITNANMKAVSGVNGAILMAGGAEAVYQAPQRNIREEVERVKRRFITRDPRVEWFTANGTATEFDLPTRARRILTVSQNGAIAREVAGAGASKYTVKDYGYKQAILFGTAPAAGDVGVTYVEDI